MDLDFLNYDNFQEMLKGPWIKGIKIWWWIGCFITFFYSTWGFLFFVILGFTIKGYELKLKDADYKDGDANG